MFTVILFLNRATVVTGIKFRRLSRLDIQNIDEQNKYSSIRYFLFF